MATDKPRFSISVDEEMRRFIIDYQHRNKLSTQTKAVIALIEKGIDAIKRNDTTPVTNNAPSNKDEALLGSFHQLNDEGQERLLETADDMVQSGKYIKTNSPELGKKA